MGMGPGMIVCLARISGKGKRNEDASLIFQIVLFLLKFPKTWQVL